MNEAGKLHTQLNVTHKRKPSLTIAGLFYKLTAMYTYGAEILSKFHLRPKIMDGHSNDSKPLPNFDKRIFPRNIGDSHWQPIELCIFVADHEKKRAPQLMRLQILLGIEPVHECTKVGAVFLQLPPAVHFEQRKQLHAQTADNLR